MFSHLKYLQFVFQPWLKSGMKTITTKQGWTPTRWGNEKWKGTGNKEGERDRRSISKRWKRGEETADWKEMTTTDIEAGRHRITTENNDGYFKNSR